MKRKTIRFSRVYERMDVGPAIDLNLHLVIRKKMFLINGFFVIRRYLFGKENIVVL
jgi:hypothetical protein